MKNKEAGKAKSKQRKRHKSREAEKQRSIQAKKQQKQKAEKQKHKQTKKHKSKTAEQQKEVRGLKNKVGDLKNKGPVYFDKISCTCAAQLCTCAAQHYLYNNRAKNREREIYIYINMKAVILINLSSCISSIALPPWQTKYYDIE